VNLAAIHGEEDVGSVCHGRLLIRFAEALVADDAGLERARADLAAAAGAAALVEAAGVASNFQRMVRIADATGITLGERLERMSADARAELGLEHFRHS
jgi:hypothetical protein